MSNQQDTIRRLKELITNYKQHRLRMRLEEVTAQNRTIMFQFKNNLLEELETLIENLEEEN